MINGKSLNIEGRDPNTKVSYIFDGIYRTYPILRRVNFAIVNSTGKVLDKNKTLQDSGVCYQTPNVAAVGVPDYIFGPEGIIKKMKTNGEWVYDEQMIAILGLEV